jgi:RNA polymerase sigma factor (sigma-70 family)
MRLNATAVEGIQTLFDWGTMSGWGYDRLISRVRLGQEGSDAAFRVLIQRNGPMVMGVCRRVLGDEHAAEDAFQASFLVLLKKAGTLRNCDLLSNWLHGVALRVAVKEKAKTARRRLFERRVRQPSGGGCDELEQSELRSVIDEEIRRLPERYRAPLVLYYMEGLHLEVVANRLGCPVGTAHSRLSRARDRLQSALTRRGLAPTASGVGVFLNPPGASALGLPLVEATVRNSVRIGVRGGAGKALAWSILKPALGVAPSLHAGVLASGLCLCFGLAVLGGWVYRGTGQPSRSTATAVESYETIESKATPAMPKSPVRHAGQAEGVGPSPRAVNGTRGQGGPPAASRLASALAIPLAGISVDGRLDDWPGDLHHYPIRNQIIGNAVYDSRSRATGGDPDGYFMVGYDAKAGLVYVAVVVRDDENVLVANARRTDDRVCLETDAVEIFVDGTHSDRK